VIDTTTQAVVATIPVGQWPRGIAIAPDGSALFVANRGSGTVQILDPHRAAVVATIPVGGSPYGIAALGV
jgi:YVTN family beta-propeller protein